MKRKIFSVLILSMFLIMSSGMAYAVTDHVDSRDSVSINNDTCLEVVSVNKNNNDEFNESSVKTNESKDSVSAVTGGIRNISLSDGYNGYCISMTKHYAEVGQLFTSEATSVITNDNDESLVGEYLKIFFYKYHDSIIQNKDWTQDIIWEFTYHDYLNRTDETVKDIIKNYNDGLRIADHGAVKQINDTTEAIFDFEALISGNSDIQNYFGYKINYRDISTNGTVVANETNGTVVANETNGTVVANETNVISNVKINNLLNTGNPIFLLLIAAVILTIIPFRTRK